MCSLHTTNYYNTAAAAAAAAAAADVTPLLLLLWLPLSFFFKLNIKNLPVYNTV